MIIALTNDLFFLAKIRTTAAALDKELVLAKDQDTFLEMVKKQPEKILIDLNFSKFNVLNTIGSIDTSNIYTVGYLSHVQKDLEAKAEKYLDLVLPRSDFSKRLPELLS